MAEILTQCYDTYWFEAEWERLLCEWEKLLCNTITWIEIRSVYPASGKNRDKIVSLLVEVFFFFENSLWRITKFLPAQLW